MTPDPITIFARLAAARQRLIDADIPPADAAIDVELYARTILGWDRARLLANLQETAPDTLEPRFSEWVDRRAAHEPSAYIVGTREFWGLDFEVTPAVLIPRPETEFVVEESLALLRPLPSPRVADIGTGSGCIAVALARELATCHIVATDVSADALAVARRNTERHGVAGRVELIATAYLGGVDGDFDLIAANPPYVRDGDKPALARDVRHEPDVALFGGATGLRDVEAVLETAVAKLRMHGSLVMEFGFGQEDQIRTLVRARPQLRLDHVREDLQGIPRTLVLQRT